MWNEFRKFTQRQKNNEISSPKLWALTLQKLYEKKREPIFLNTLLNSVYCSFKFIKTYRLPNQTSFGTVRRLPKHILDALLSEPPFKIKTYVGFGIS